MTRHLELSYYPAAASAGPIPALLISCGLRRAELVGLEVDRIQQREGRWVIPDLVGKGNRLRTVTIPASGKGENRRVDPSRDNF